MPSLKFEIINSPKLEGARKYNKQHQRMKDRAKEGRGGEPKQRMPSNNTVAQYTKGAIKFGEWCKERYGCRHFEECRRHIQDYADYMVAKGLSADTIHTYLAGVCFVFDVPLKDIRKPIRHSALATKSRGKKKSDARRDAQPDCSPRLYTLNGIIGNRRRELLRLRGDCLTTDESGHLCIEIRKGKGGKYQLQRVPVGSEELVRSCFSGRPEDFVFTREEMKNKLDLHAQRHRVALREYRSYEQRLREDSTYREQLLAEVKKRWERYNNRTFNEREAAGRYVMRGKNRALAMEYGAQVSFDRLAVLATSIFHLAHWRNNVTVSNYLLPALVAEAEEREGK